MKKLVYLFLTVLIVACSGDDSNNNNVTNSLEGRWDYTSSYDDGLGHNQNLTLLTVTLKILTTPYNSYYLVGFFSF